MTRTSFASASRSANAVTGAAVRVMMSTTIARPAGGALRPLRRFGLIDIALEPLAKSLGAADPDALAQLGRDLAVVVSAEAYFTLIDLCELTPEEAIASAVRTATTVVRAASSTAVGSTTRQTRSSQSRRGRNVSAETDGATGTATGALVEPR
jgi:hypothetical protein